MNQPIRHNHPSIETVDGTVERHGSSNRRRIRLPEEISVEESTVVRLILDGSEYHSQLQAVGGPGLAVVHVAETPRLARNPPTARNHLPGWIRERDLDVGRTVHVDIVDPGRLYGLRSPGEDGTYPSETHDGKLADIARNLDES
ncbi:MAG: hypothetical protein ABEJ58_02640 [Halodesulfurarchaeum sp.]